MAAQPALTSLELTVDAGSRVATVWLNRPRSANSLTLELMRELGAAFAYLEALPDVRAVVLAARGSRFCAGIDLGTLSQLLAAGREQHACPGRRGRDLYRTVRSMQDAVSALERYPYPVVCAIQGACVGGGVHLASAADIRVAARDATFCVKEADLAIVADLGALQRLPGIIGEGRTRELALTCRTFDADEALLVGFVSACCDDAEAALRAARALAAQLAAKSPLAVTGTKALLVQQQKAAVEASLERVAWSNAAQLRSADIDEALAARAQKRPPAFARL